MAKLSLERKWDQHTTGRKCGNCTACCIYLGIEELKKPTTVKCKHLRGPAHIHKRCSIYRNRPVSCSEYTCVWLDGWGPEELHPIKSGMLITFYDSDSQGEQNLVVTLNVFDSKKADKLQDQVIGELIMIPGMVEVRVNILQSKTGLLFRAGHIYRGTVIVSDEDVESFKFEARETIGTYGLGT